MRLAWRSLVRLMDGSRRLIGVSGGIAVAQAALLVPIAFVVQRAFDTTITEGDSADLILLGALILGLFSFSAALGLLNRWYALRVTKEAMRRLMTEVVARLFALPRSYFDRHDLGTLHATIVQDSERLDAMANALVSMLIPTVVIGCALGVTMAVISPLLFGVLLVSIPLMLFVSRRLTPRIRSLTREWQEASDRFSSDTQVALRSVTLTKLHGAEETELERRRPGLAAVAETGRSMAWWQAVYSAQQLWIAAAAAVIVLVVGGVAVSEGTLTLGDLISFYAVLGLFRNLVLSGTVSIPQVISGSESLARLENLIAEPAREPYEGRRQLSFQGAVALDGVSFEYRPGEPILRDVSIGVQPGETVLLLGPNGAGKSTVLRLIAGLYAPDAGAVLADGIPLTEWDMRGFRRQIGVVSQNPLIVPASLRANIAFGRPGASDEEVAGAAALAGADGFIAELPGGYDAPVGDDGVLLSGGQRQRIAVARALLGEPKLLMLDEPTTHLDRDGATALIERLNDRDGGPTVLVVSHDPVAVEIADRVYELRGGEVSVLEAGPVRIEPVGPQSSSSA